MRRSESDEKEKKGCSRQRKWPVPKSSKEKHKSWAWSTGAWGRELVCRLKRIKEDLHQGLDLGLPKMPKAESI